jgi:hypothetical protein
MSATLAPFETSCVMCGWRRETFRFCPHPHADLSRPHLHRICERCGYEWLTHTVDPEAPQVPVIDSPYLAEALLQTLAHGLQAGATALDNAAFTLREAGRGVPASAAKRAAGKLRHLHHELTGRSAA